MLCAERLISHEMESQEHHKRIPVKQLRRIFERIRFSGFVHRYFEFGLNNLLVATRANLGVIFRAPAFRNVIFRNSGPETQLTLSDPVFIIVLVHFSR